MGDFVSQSEIGPAVDGADWWRGIAVHPMEDDDVTRGDGRSSVIVDNFQHSKRLVSDFQSRKPNLLISGTKAGHM